MKKFLVFYFLFLFFFLSFFASGVIDSQDGFQYLAVARNIYYKGEPTAPVYEYDKEKNIHMSTYLGKDGKTYSPTGLGYSLAMVPAVAVTDLVYKAYGVSPPVHFPLENDWLILLTASFTNAFFGALLGVIMFSYFNLLGLTKKQSLFMSLIALFTTNLFVYTKHSLAHMMFIAFLLISFLMLKLHSMKKKNIYLIFAGLSYGVVAITYNLTFVLSILVLVIYYFLLNKKRVLNDGFWFFLGALPFIVLFFWFENLRQHAELASASIASQAGYGVYQLLNVPIGVFIEGIYGQLFSPGRSIFLYSPLLLIPILFWYKIKRRIFPELWAFILLSAIYIFFYATQFSLGRSFKDQGYAALWHGEASWGPRYLSVLIPFGMLVVGYIYQYLSKKAKIFIFLPLAIFGLYVELLGVLMPYQIKFHDLEHRFYVNNTEYTVFAYSNLLPRYSPIFMMSKKLIKSIKNWPETLNNGQYNLRFYDGVDFAFNLGGEDRWRVIEQKGYISFDNFAKKSIRQMTFHLVNHPVLKGASSPASVRFSLNNKLLKKQEGIMVAERIPIEITVPKDILKQKNNQLLVDVSFDDSNAYQNKKQWIALISMFINGKEVNKESIDVPYISALGPKMTGVTYKNWGGANKNLWKTWDIHTQIFERTPDFWWIKQFYYWDYPRQLFTLLFIINLSGIITFGYLLIKKS